jgi:two-component system response regulator NreC
MRIVVADDHRLVRSALRLLLAADPELEVVGEAADVATTEHLVKTLQPDVLLLDVTMPGGSGLDAIRALHQLAPAMPVIVLTMHADARFARRALRSGASGYVLKERADSDLVPAINAAGVLGSGPDSGFGDSGRT